MVSPMMLLPAAVMLASLATLSTAAVLFHGTSVVIQPSHETSSPSNSTVLAANFFCYMADEGYISFGWWVPASLNSEPPSCDPDSREYHWYEHAVKESCDDVGGTCRYRTQNFLVNAPPGGRRKHPFPARSLEYVIRPLNLGNGRYGELAQSYIDDGEVQVYAVGSRRELSGSEINAAECRKALETLVDVQSVYKPELPFNITDVCGPAESQPKFRVQ